MGSLPCTKVQKNNNVGDYGQLWELLHVFCLFKSLIHLNGISTLRVSPE